jgi:hypothetical protein
MSILKTPPHNDCYMLYYEPLFFKSLEMQVKVFIDTNETGFYLKDLIFFDKVPFKEYIRVYKTAYKSLEECLEKNKYLQYEMINTLLQTQNWDSIKPYTLEEAQTITNPLHKKAILHALKHYSPDFYYFWVNKSVLISVNHCEELTLLQKSRIYKTFTTNWHKIVGDISIYDTNNVYSLEKSKELELVFWADFEKAISYNLLDINDVEEIETFPQDIKNLIFHKLENQTTY